MVQGGMSTRDASLRIPEEFRKDAVALYRAAVGKRTYAAVAADLGITAESLRTDTTSKTTAVARGERATCSSTRVPRVDGEAGCPVSFQSRSTRCRSASVRSGNARTARPGSSAAAASRWLRVCPSRTDPRVPASLVAGTPVWNSGKRFVWLDEARSPDPAARDSISPPPAARPQERNGPGQALPGTVRSALRGSQELLTSGLRVLGTRQGHLQCSHHCLVVPGEEVEGPRGRNRGVGRRETPVHGG